MFRSLLVVFALLLASHSFAQLRANTAVQLKSKSNYTATKYAVDSDLAIITGGIPGTFGDVDGGIVTPQTELEYAKSQWIRVIIRQSELTVNETTFQQAIEDGTWQKIEKARVHWLNEIERLTPNSTTEP
jgi:hypothetical protein